MSANMRSGQLDEAQLELVVRAFGKALSNAFMYGVKHDVTSKAIDETYAGVRACFAQVEELSITVSDDTLVINRVVVPQKNTLVRMFVTKVLGMKVGNVTLDSSLTRSQLSNLIEILNASPEELAKLGGFVAFATQVGLTAVKVRTVRFQEVTEDEHVVSKDAVKGKGEGEGGEGEESADAAREVAEDGEAPAEPSGGKVRIDSIVAFLKGTVELSEEVAQGIQDTMPDAQKLGELILQTAHMNVEQANVEGAESLAGLVVGCLRKTYQAMKKDPVSKTQKGKKSLTKQLMLLEKEIIDKMRAMGEQVGEDDLDTVRDACEEIMDEIKMEALAGEYMKKRTQVESNERRIMRYMRGKTEAELEEHELKDMLMEGGMSPEGWQELMVRSGVAGTGERKGGGEGKGGGADMGVAALGQLATLLTRMEETIAAVKSGGEDVHVPVAEVRNEVTKLVEHTQAQIRSLVSEVHGDVDLVDEAEQVARRLGKGPRMTRKEILATLAEIAQELCQPLAVINGSLEMIKSGVLGDVTTTQGEMLDLATESSDKLQMLTKALQGIAGLPASMTPDEALQSSIYA